MNAPNNTEFPATVTENKSWDSFHHDSWFAGAPAATSTILIADASLDRRQHLHCILSGLSLRVFEAASVKEVISAVASQMPDLVLLDLNLPDGDVLKLCRTLKGANATRFLPVFVKAQAGDEEAEIQAFQAGADHFFSGNVRPHSLCSRVQGALRHKANIDSLDGSEGVLISLAQSLEARDADLGEHCERLALMSSTMGQALGLASQDILTLQRAGFLHDIGKVSIPDSILFKAGPLTPAEWQVMESHAERGERICSNLRSLAPVLPVIRHHHEKWNGTGYPDRLQGTEIPLLAQILQLADVYDALTTARCYKPAFTSDQAVAIMRQEAQKGWRNSQLTEKFIELIPAFSSVSMPDPFSLSLHRLAASLEQTFHASMQ